MKIGCFFFVLVWTIVAVVLTLCGVGAFAQWPITAWPWNWSCLCILYWDLILTVALVVFMLLLKLFLAWRREKVINSYAPEQREFIRRMMNK